MTNSDSTLNTLAAHNVQVGDVVKYKGIRQFTIESVKGEFYYEKYDPLSYLSLEPLWTVVSRYNPKPAHKFGEWEWTKGNAPSGLVQPWYRDKTQSQAEAAEIYDTSMLDWGFHEKSVARIIAFRRVIGPVRGYVSFTTDINSLTHTGAVCDPTHRLTLPTEDGALIADEYIGKRSGAVVRVEIIM